MASLIRNGAWEIEYWRHFAPAPDLVLPPDEDGWMIAPALWREHAATLRRRSYPLGIALQPDAEPGLLFAGESSVASGGGVAFLAVHFPEYTDGRGFSLAQILRAHYGWQGELRALGDVLVDTVHYLSRCGFDSFVLKDGHDPQQALAALGAFTVHYQ